jgi:dihydrofolate reductase
VRVGVIVAMAENGVIGRKGSLPWHLPDDLAHFKQVTMGCPVIMGRKTWQSIGRPLPGRRNLVLSRSAPLAEGITVAASLDEALAAAAPAERVWVIGGAAVYAAALPRAERLEVTRVHASLEGDAFFPALDWSEWQCVDRRPHGADVRHAFAFTFERWERRGAAGG